MNLWERQSGIGFSFRKVFMTTKTQLDFDQAISSLNQNFIDKTSIERGVLGWYGDVGFVSVSRPLPTEPYFERFFKSMLRSNSILSIFWRRTLKAFLAKLWNLLMSNRSNYFSHFTFSYLLGKCSVTFGFLMSWFGHHQSRMESNHAWWLEIMTKEYFYHFTVKTLPGKFGEPR